MFNLKSCDLGSDLGSDLEIRFGDQIWRCARFNLVAHQIEPCVYFYLTFNQNKLITVQQKEIFPFTDSAD